MSARTLLCQWTFSFLGCALRAIHESLPAGFRVSARRASRRPSVTRLKLVCRRANQSADNRPDRSSSERNPPSVPAAVMDVVNDMMPRRRRAIRMMPPAMMRGGNRRTRRQNHPSHENRNCLDDLVHITPATFCFDFLWEPISRSQRGRGRHHPNLTKTFEQPHSVSVSRKRPQRGPTHWQSVAAKTSSPWCESHSERRRTLRRLLRKSRRPYRNPRQ